MGKSLDFYKKNIRSLSFSGVSVDEQETVIVFSSNNDKASVETTDSTVITKLKTYATTNTDEREKTGRLCVNRTLVLIGKPEPRRIYLLLER